MISKVSIKMMVVALAFLLAAPLPLSSQVRFSPVLEVVAGAGFNRGPRITFAPQFVGRLELGKGFNVGTGVGARFAIPCLRYDISDGKFNGRTDCLELDIPIFLRAGYEFKIFYANLDMGYAVGAISAYMPDAAPGGKKQPSFNGLFFEPHAGIKLGQHHTIALGVLLQHSKISFRTSERIWDPETSSYHGVKVNTEDKRKFPPAITLRYGYIF